MSIVYVEIPAPQMAPMIQFYRDVFSWQIEASDLTDTPYAMFSTDGGIGGGLDSSLPVQGGGVILYIKVGDIPRTLQKIQTLGGEVVREKFAIGADYGYSALFKDPCGNRLGLWCKE